MMEQDERKAFLAELLGTFVLVFIGAGAVALAPFMGDGPVGPALAHGLVLVSLIYSYGHLSGGQFNPAVSVALLVGGAQDGARTLRFLIAQFAGAIVAGMAVAALFPPQILEVGNIHGATIGRLTADMPATAAVIEGILTFLLVSAVYQAAVFGKAGNLAPLAIGFTRAACILAGGVLTGASLNPARTLGPAIMAGDLSYVPAYFLGIFGGGVAGGLFHSRVLNSVNKA